MTNWQQFHDNKTNIERDQVTVVLTVKDCKATPNLCRTENKIFKLIAFMKSGEKN